MEKDELYKMRKAVQAMRNKGELERYNSLKAKEQKEDERIEQQLVDLNTGVQKQPQAVHQSRVQITRTITSMIDKKKVVMDNVSIKSTTNIINHKNIEIEKTTTTTTIQPSSLHHQTEKRGSYVGGSSML